MGRAGRGEVLLSMIALLVLYSNCRQKQGTDRQTDGLAAALFSVPITGSCDIIVVCTAFWQQISAQFCSYCNWLLRPARRVRSTDIVMSMSGCLSVRSYNSKTTRTDLTKFLLHVACRRDSVLLSRRRDILCFRFCG